jgi:hypothetical protein
MVINTASIATITLLSKVQAYHSMMTQINWATSTLTISKAMWNPSKKLNSRNLKDSCMITIQQF